MTNSQKLTVRASEIRQRLNEISGLEGDALTEEVRAESDALTTEYRDTETKLRAALVAEPEPRIETTDVTLDAEARERLELRGRVTFGGYLLAALQHRVPSGAEAEYAAAFGARPGHIPLDLWEGDRPQTEHRATTPAPATGTGVTVAPVQPFVFAPSIAPRLGIDMPTVPSGSYTEMTVTTKVPAAPRAKGNDDDFTAAALTPITAAPRRISARMSVTIEDVAAIGQANFESALRQNVSMSLSDAYDSQAIAGNGTAPNVEVLLDQLDDPTDPSAINTFATFLSSAAAQIDGLWASMLSEVSIVAHPTVYRLSATVFRANSSDSSFSDYARNNLGGWWTSNRMPGAVSTIVSGIAYRMGRPGLRTACHPTWGTVSIEDIYTDSRSGIRHFTVHVLVGSKVLIVQPGAYSRVDYKVA